MNNKMHDQGQQRIAGTLLLVASAGGTAWLWYAATQGSFDLSIPRLALVAVFLLPLLAVVGLGLIVWPFGPDVPRSRSSTGAPYVHPRDLPFRWWLTIAVAISAALGVGNNFPVLSQYLPW